MILEELSRASLGPDGPAFWLLVAVALLALVAVVYGAMRAKAAERRLSRRVDAAFSKIDQLFRDEAGRTREDDDRRAREMRQELRAQIDAAADAQTKAAGALRGEVNAAVKSFGDSLKQDVDGLSRTLKDRFSTFSEGLTDRQSAFEKGVGEKLGASTETIAALARGNAEAHAQLKSTVEERLEKLRVDNEAKLEQMRQTVDEKLQSTLEKRLGESFKHVSERLEHVHRGLGEMQTLAAGVGDLKKVLTNVKDRGGWAEIQLGALLDQMLARDQYVVNAKIDPNSNETVEFAVKFPGRNENGEVLVPIDAKFPKEDYERLVAAWEAGDAEQAISAIEALDRIIEAEAKKIASKYIRPPHSTDFAIMFLPTEGLYAEVMRRPGLASKLQSKHRITVAGPTTLWAILTAFRTGFQTLEIEKRSSDVWQVLGEAKSEFVKYAQVWDKLGKQLQTAQNTVDEAGRRTRAVSKRLERVEALEPTGSEPSGILIDLRSSFEDEPTGADE